MSATNPSNTKWMFKQRFNGYREEKKNFMVEEVLTARRVKVSWRKDEVEGSQCFDNKIIGIKYTKLKINEEGFFCLEQLSRKNQ